jgi:hypothetical protein
MTLLASTDEHVLRAKGKPIVPQTWAVFSAMPQGIFVSFSLHVQRVN